MAREPSTKATRTPAAKKSKAPKAAAKKKAAKQGARLTAAEMSAREDVVFAGILLERSQLTPGRSGNVSVRFGDGMLISPSGMYYSDITPDDVVFVAADGEPSRSERKPSSEWRFHLAAFQARPDRSAVVHTHAKYATILACRHEPIPAFHYMVAVAGGIDIPCVPYAPFGSEALADYVADGVRKRDACLMANHGLTVVGSDMEHALEITREVEQLAEQYVHVLALGGPKTLTDDEMADVMERFKTYGSNAQS